MLKQKPINILAGGLIAGSVLANGNMATAQVMTAGVIVEKMEADELAGFISGVIEGLAYARFRKDTIAAGSKDERGMNCIYNWYYASNDQPAGILATFRKYPDRMPGTIVALMVKQECGE
ncbi:MAG: hypothetical protein M9955_08945 [Rhizobiaceae bacterium]|nr:hypothetical protein [Rhizobiaceae bacterium]